MKKKFYAVRKGRKTGIFTTYEECLEQVQGYSGAEFKGFGSESDAKNYLGLLVKSSTLNRYVTEATAYVDGSFHGTNQTYGSGIVLLHQGLEYRFSQPGCNPELIPSQNVAGEVMAAEIAISHCLENGIRSLTIYYDYLGIFLWAIGKWEANSKISIQYKNFVSEARKNLFIHFEKVAAHSGNYYNDIADMLAKQAAGLT